MSRYLTRLLRDEEAATSIEYGLLAAMIAIALIGGMNAWSAGLTNMFDYVDETLENRPT